MLQATANLNDELAGLNLPAEQARRPWQALEAAERQAYPSPITAGAITLWHQLGDPAGCGGRGACVCTVRGGWTSHT